ncbi:TNF receptor-associated factor 6-like [Oscarella lobularis]|uniref:TNF receptor-associated factor 6-like n=1 Tax=Oscarella lobularis TaxID=121494 RepID=UPI003313C4A3
MSAVGGFDAKFAHLPNNLSCPICHVGIRDPLLTFCGHRFCATCVEPLRTKKRSLTCPICREELRPDQVYPDNAIKRDVLDLEVACHLDEMGCKWRGELRELKNHETKCEFVIVPCAQCSANVMRQHINEHLQKTCSRRKVSCRHCLKLILFQNLKEHLQDCPLCPLFCPQGCRKRLVRRQIRQHVAENGTCPNTYVACPLSACDFKGKRKDVLRHKSERVEYHLDLSLIEVKRLKDDVRKSESETAELKREIASLKGEMRNSKGETTDLKHEIAHLKSEIADMKKQISKSESPFVYLWRVTDWASHFEKAKSHSDYSVACHPVYISTPGHRVKPKIYPNNEMSGYVGIFLFIAKGHYDDFIEWPFNTDYSFTVIDQQRNGENETMRMFADVAMVEILRQNSTGGYGFHRFISHDRLEERMFVRSDCLFLKLVVHL